ncbi:MAG: fluoride efflux transporter CrcB [Gammaproteobacteria bacterium]
MIHQLSLVAAGGAIGAMLRFLISSTVAQLFGREFPYGTLLVNVLGSFLIGVTFVLLSERIADGSAWRTFLVVGVLGALTTFSTFSMETVHFLQVGLLERALTNVLANVVLCLLACWFGLLLMRPA